MGVTIACTGVRESAVLKWKIFRAYPVTRDVTPMIFQLERQRESY
ncbi:hypothetical protein Mal65_02010 [Crateriforma conspicua]|nr:hypothetical protein Mal65_02010 [Crateriforma conspicua]